MSFVDIEKAFITVPRNLMKWAVRKKGFHEVIIVRVVMSLYRVAKTKVRVRSQLSEEFGTS